MLSIREGRCDQGVILPFPDRWSIQTARLSTSRGQCIETGINSAPQGQCV